MAFLANGVVLRLGLVRPTVPFLILLGILGLGLAIIHAGGFPTTRIGQMGALITLTCPMFFSGIAFSALLAKTGDISSALAMNLLGALAGGLLEYNSMYFGFRSLYWMAMAIYAAALLSDWIAKRVDRGVSPQPPNL